MGAIHVPKDVDEVQVDKNLLLVTTPAFMKEAEFYKIYDGIGKMINEVVKLCN
jgi:enhancing lycopene biosynthesis protein 2